MSIRVRVSDAERDQVGNASVRRYVRRGAGSRFGVGVTTFAPLPSDVRPETLWEAHDVPEVHYVLSGAGVLFEEGEAIELTAGDVVITPPGARHVLWGESEAQPLVTFYAAFDGPDRLSER